jgi:5-methylcytosine-specific restriction endonuclease McrA
VHHLQPQKDADDEGMIGAFHKNNLANLVTLCESCHDEMHKEGGNHKKVKTTKGSRVVKNK